MMTLCQVVTYEPAKAWKVIYADIPIFDRLYVTYIVIACNLYLCYILSCFIFDSIVSFSLCCKAIQIQTSCRVLHQISSI